MRAIVLLLFSATAFAQPQATCWPTASTLKKHYAYFCAVDVPPGVVVTGRQLMAALAELEPVPESLAVQAGGDQNRISPRNVTNLTEQYILPGISAATALDGIKISETHWQALVVMSPVLFRIIKGVIFGTAPSEWSRPSGMVGDGEIPVDSRGSASAMLYTRREDGVRRISLARPTSEALPAQFNKSIQLTDWYTALVEARCRQLRRLEMNQAELLAGVL